MIKISKKLLILRIYWHKKKIVQNYLMMMIMNCFYGIVDRRKAFPAGTIVRDPHHRESPLRRLRHAGRRV